MDMQMDFGQAQKAEFAEIKAFYWQLIEIMQAESAVIGFDFVEAKQMFYEDTGWTEYIMYDLDLRTVKGNR